MNRANFDVILKNNNLIETKSCFLFFIINVFDKISSKGNKYKYIETIDKEQNKKWFYFFNLKSNIQPEKNTFIYAQFAPLGENWKIETIYEKIKNPFNFNCSECIWKNQSVCKKCNCGSYFQKQEQEINKVKTNNIFVTTDFENEEEIETQISYNTKVNVNDYFDSKPEIVDFWEKNDLKKCN